MKVGFITLGCDKNTVDTERYLGLLSEYGGEYTASLDQADVIIVNTCGFIDAAKKESIDAMIEAARYKTDGSCQAVVGVGCMIERHKAELMEAIPEVDLFLGASEAGRLAQELADRGVIGGDPVALHPGVRMYTGDLPHVRYLKISEGCDHGCAFCAIPLMRGKHRSFARDEVIREAQLLELQGAKELNLVAQDLAHYGRDIRDGVRLPELLEALVAETSVPWIRMLYLYSTGITPRLLEVVARESRILPYLDMPMQHASDVVLARMRRPERKRTIRDRVARFREAVPGVAIRTTCIVGFPGETDADFEELMEFLEETQFDRVGAFTYSPQEGTRAADMEDDVPDPVKRERLERLTELQRSITGEKYESRIGTRAQLIVDRINDGASVGRLPWQADDVDGITYLDELHAPGTLLEVAVHDVIDDYDFKASVVGVIASESRPIVAVPRRSLPMMGITVGSYGR
ncbi:MAG TPA: 30S ribosomal protein S12 methylthiotransferase RimO [Gemmatimonadaceae bacterium]|nr:30S ribosomal protein S12 methylthiotransferase RimO [Gemmatimonadaceae bacterium]